MTKSLKKAEPAAKVGLLPGHLGEPFKRKRNIRARPEKALAISAEYGLALQSAYDLAREPEAA